MLLGSLKPKPGAKIKRLFLLKIFFLLAQLIHYQNMATTTTQISKIHCLNIAKLTYLFEKTKHLPGL